MVFGVRAFVFRIKGATWQDLLDAFLQAKPRVESLLERHEEPFIAKIYKEGDVDLWLTFEQWAARQEGAE